MHIAITGANGFIASRLIISLRHKYPNARFTLLDIESASDHGNDISLVDIMNVHDLEKSLQDVDILYHLAAEHRDDVKPISRYYDVNVEGTKNVIDAAKKNNIQTIIFTSTVAIYGLDTNISKETDVPKPFNDYGQSKWEAEQELQKWAQSNEKRTLIILRLVATFGPGNRGNIYNLMNQIKNKKFMMIGNGKNCKSIAYVDNVAEFMTSILKQNFPGSHIFNYADKPDADMNTLVSTIREALNFKNAPMRLPYWIGYMGGISFDIISKITGQNFPISAIRVKKFCSHTVVNADKAHQTEFIPPYSLADGIKKMIGTEFHG